MSPLEQRYRRLLRALPEPARSRWADEMTDTYLTATCADDPEFADFGSPALVDRLDVWRLALRLRLGAPGAAPRAVVTGAAVRWVALLGALGATAPAAIGQLGRLTSPDLPWVVTWQTPLVVTAAVLSVALFGCLVHGSWVARPVAGVLLAVHLVLGVSVAGPVPVSTWVVLLLAAVPPVAALVSEPAPAARPARWWAGAVTVLVLTGGLPWLSLVLPVWITGEAVWAAVLAAVGLRALVAGEVVVRRAVAVLGLLAVVPLALSATAGGGPTGYVATQAGAAAVLAVVAGACAVTATRDRHRLPA
ncbi:hypothetical protein SAMN05660199_00963 [Klenkia soli]|uniref:Uncharacterized protein n=1 Tax=Klenkia soli TaxID=1052260 RepID=A0A1H0F639_9ACTN|nr:hypothetical protein [Klenkia soli]SDN90041.1 hypothetical protein SAMN05660199_00963 [Klenkia soli]